MFLAYQSPASGWHCGPQCAHMPNLASRNHSGVLKSCNDSQVGLNGPFAMDSFKNWSSKKLPARERDNHREGKVAAIPLMSVLRFIFRSGEFYKSFFAVSASPAMEAAGFLESGAFM